MPALSELSEIAGGKAEGPEPKPRAFIWRSELKSPSERVLQLLRRAEADGLGRLQLHDLVGLRVRDPARLAGASGPGPEPRVAEAVVLLHRAADVVENNVDELRGRLL